MIKRSHQHHHSNSGKIPLNINDLGNADFSDNSDSDLNDDHVVMLSWNNGKVQYSLTIRYCGYCYFMAIVNNYYR